MTTELTIQLLLGAVTYILFHLSFFRYAGKVLDGPEISLPLCALAYLVNFSFFLLATRLQLHLCINWTLICLIFTLEVRFLYGRDIWACALTALDGAMVGLATNILTRCVTAILLNRPLSHFDNNMYSSFNIKVYPISVAFLMAGAVFALTLRTGKPETRRMTLQDRQGTRFLLLLNAILYLFLLLNLLAYYTDGNFLTMKLWGIKSALFVVFGASVADYYVARLCKVRQFQQKILADRRELVRQKQQSGRTRYLAFTDPLTGCYNRAYVEEIFSELEEVETDVALCFLDLDGLKQVNDTFGHMEGDHYLRLAAALMKECVDGRKDYLFRYGGDEFLILYTGRTAAEVRGMAAKLKQRAASCSHSGMCAYPVSISCGIAFRQEGKNLREVLKLADGRMYEEKRTHRAAG